MDFARADLSVFPYVERNGFIVGNEISGFGHDDRAGIFAGLNAMKESIFSKSDNTMIFLGLDREEIGNVGASCSYEGFIKKVLNETTEVVFPRGIKPSGGVESLLGNTPVLSVDTEVGFGDIELADDENLDFRKAPKVGWGFYINGFDSDWSRTKVSAKQVGDLMDLMNSNLGKSAKERYQVLGGYVQKEAPFGTATMADVFGNNFSTLDIGVPVMGLHHPRAEVLNIFDLYWLKEAIGLHLRA
jgi:aspartyl aminopeptidase